MVTWTSKVSTYLKSQVFCDMAVCYWVQSSLFNLYMYLLSFFTIYNTFALASSDKFSVQWKYDSDICGHLL